MEWQPINEIDKTLFRLIDPVQPLNKNDVVYFEHSLGAVKSAESVGINSYHYDPEKKDLEGLKKFLTENL